jgi:hypothetical protein
MNKGLNMQPYFYKIQHKLSGKIYVGSQYGKFSDSTNFWKTYYTSSKYVKELIKTDGINSFDVIKIQIRLDAREYERRYLKKCFNIFGKEKFLKTFLNKNLSPGILLTEEMIEKANIKRKTSNSLAAKKMLLEKRHNFQKNNAGNYEHVKKERSERMMGNNFGSKRKMTDNLKEKLAEKSKGNTNVRGTRWWNDGNKNKRSIEQPGQNFKLGIINDKEKAK